MASGYVWYQIDAPVGPAPPLDIRIDLATYGGNNCTVSYNPIVLGLTAYANTGTYTFGPYALDAAAVSIKPGIHYQFTGERRSSTVHEVMYWGPTSAAHTITLFDHTRSGPLPGDYYWPDYCFNFSTGTSGDCSYGTELKPGQDAQVWLSDTLLQLVVAALPQSWWGILLGVFAGQALNVANMCAELPIIPPPPVATDFLPPFIGLQKYVAPMLWNYFCQCKSGPVTPPPPVIDFGSKPTGLADDRTIVVNPTNPCLDLTEVRRMLDRIMKVLGQDYALDTLMQRYELPFATVRGATHSGLGGTGSFNISRLIGVQITITARPPNRELEGAPTYVWDLGWISCMDGNGFIQERRITRDVEVWMPREFQEATILGYMFKTGVTANITELQAES